MPELHTYPEERLAISNENHSMLKVLKEKITIRKNQI